MQYRLLGETGLEISTLSFGASSLGAEFRNIDISEALSSVRVALDCGMNFIDTSPYYGRGMSEVLLGQVLPQVSRESYFLGSKLGRYAPTHFDFSARRVVESVDLSLERMKVDYLDVILCHDVEFMELDQILQETLPALEKIRTQGKVRFIGVSGYPMKMFRYFLERADLDVILSYNHFEKSRLWYQKYNLDHISDEKERKEALYSMTRDYRKAIREEPLELIAYVAATTNRLPR